MIAKNNPNKDGKKFLPILLKNSGEKEEEALTFTAPTES